MMLKCDLYFWICLISIHKNKSIAESSILKVSTVEVEPYYHRYKDVKTGQTHEKGYIVDLIAEISKRIKKEYQINVVEDGEYGQIDKNGKWTGVIGELSKENADVAAAPLFITDLRKKEVDFSMPFMNVSATILLRRPPVGSTLHISSVRELINQSEIKYGTMNTSLILWTFKNTSDPVMKIMWRKMHRFKPSTLTTNNEEGIEKVRFDKYAFILPDTIGRYIENRYPCDLVAVDNFLMNRHYAFAFRKNSILLQLFNNTIKELNDERFLEDLYYKWWVSKGDCNTAPSSYNQIGNGCARISLGIIIPPLIYISLFT